MFLVIEEARVGVVFLQPRIEPACSSDPLMQDLVRELENVVGDEFERHSLNQV